MKKTTSFLLLAVAVVLTVSACKTKQPATTSKKDSGCKEVVTYATLKPLLDEKCNGCHSAGGQLPGLTTYSDMKKFGSVGEIKHHVLVKKDMPPEKPLTESELNMFSCWLEGGMLEK